jgi:hypothetical protein
MPHGAWSFCSDGIINIVQYSCIFLCVLTVYVSVKSICYAVGYYPKLLAAGTVPGRLSSPVAERASPLALHISHTLLLSTPATVNPERTSMDYEPTGR